MRKALIAVVVASALFAVGAFAASFAVQSEDVASGANAVDACAPNVDIDFDTPVWNDTLGDWEVKTADVTFYREVSGAPTVEDATCEGYDVTLSVEKSAGDTVLSTSTVPVANGQALNVPFPDTSVNLIDRASVLVDGKTLYANNVG